MNQIVSYDEAYAKAAQQYADDTQVTGGKFISTKGGILAVGDMLLPGNQMAVVILDGVYENDYYAGAYAPDNPASPTCYAFSRKHKDGDMAPHISMAQHPDYFVPQSETCKACPHNIFGSADVGEGKRCKNKARLHVIPCGMYVPKGRNSKDFDLDLFTDEADFAGSDVMKVMVPVTSVKHYAAYLQAINAAHNRPPYGMFTRVWMEPHPKNQHVMRFEEIELAPENLARILIARNAEAMKSIMSAYSPPEAREAPKQGGLRGLRR